MHLDDIFDGNSPFELYDKTKIENYKLDIKSIDLSTEMAAGIGLVVEDERVKKAEKVLVGNEIKDNLLEEAAQVASEEASPVPDISGSEEYKRELVRILVKRVGKEALERAKRA